MSTHLEIFIFESMEDLWAKTQVGGAPGFVRACTAESLP